jgi:UDP-N-acetyl-D-mannosaminuronate dehydrogenase
MLKYAANAFLASRISFMNEIATLCEKVGADIEMIRRGMAADSRIGPAFLFAGLGFGGSCFPKDIRALVHTCSEHKHDMKILQAVDEINKGQAVRFVERIRAHFQDNVRDKRFGVWGLAFKPATTICAMRRPFRLLKAFSQQVPISSRMILWPWKKQRGFRGPYQPCLEQLQLFGRSRRAAARHGVAGISEPQFRTNEIHDAAAADF